jgi:hypothetical protein
MYKKRAVALKMNNAHRRKVLGWAETDVAGNFLPTGKEMR